MILLTFVSVILHSCYVLTKALLTAHKQKYLLALTVSCRKPHHHHNTGYTAGEE